MLSPLLFLIYINDLPKPHHRQNSKSQFADDTALWAASKNVQFAAKLLHKDLRKLAKWCAKWRIKLNPEKAKVIIFSRSSLARNSEPILKLYGKRLKIYPQVKFLGITFDSKFTLQNHFDLIDQPQGVHKIKTTLFSISLPKLRELQSLALESTNYDYESAEYRVTAIILDTAHYRLFRPVRSDQSTDAKTHFIKLDFINKGIDAVNLPSILRSKSVTETVPTYFKEKEPPIISYTYTKSIASKIFNFSSTLSDLDYHQFHNNPTQCECNTSSHLYQPYGHVITGDLSIIPNSKLRDLIAKGPKYREPCKVDWDKNLSLLCEAVDQYALQWTKQEMVELSVLSSWKEMVKGQIEERISKLKQNFKQPTGKVLQNADVIACLSDLHNKYVFVPADKAPNNIIIICKRYYIETLIKE